MNKILIIDDSTVSRQAVKLELRVKFNVTEAKTGEEGINILPDLRPDLVITDVEMPGINGYEVCSRIRSGNSETRDVPIIILTTFDTVEERNKGFYAGAADFITKPFIQGELMNSVNNILYPSNIYNSATILCVDDSDTTLKLITNCLKRLTENIHTASTGEEGYEILKKVYDKIDLVILDQKMPGISGAELCYKIRDELGLKKLPIIMLSGISDKSEIVELFKAGANDYIIKPFVVEELLARVKVQINSKLLYNDLEQKILDLKRLSKLKDDFLSITSHDLRSPLSGLLGSADLLMQSEEIKDKNREYLNNIKNSGNFLLSLINDILDLNRSSSENVELDMSPVQVVDIVKTCVNSLKYMAIPKEINININLNGIDYSVIYGDSNSLIKIFNNIISNAVKFTPANGDVNITFFKEKNFIIIEIEDTGIGIPKNKIDGIYDKYSKFSRDGTSGEKSTGLGLSIAKELIQRHNGEISLESEIDKGTCFKIKFPILGKNMLNAFEMGSKTGDMVLSINSNLRILIVEDNAVNIKIIRAILKKMDLDSKTASNGKDAVKNFEIASKKLKISPYDLILMDINMPGMGGIESTRILRKIENDFKLKPVYIAALTASISQEEKEKCYEAGMNDYLTKPIKKDKLIKILNSIS